MHIKNHTKQGENFSENQTRETIDLTKKIASYSRVRPTQNFHWQSYQNKCHKHK